MTLNTTAQIVVADSVAEIDQHIASDATQVIQDAQTARGEAHVAVSGGSVATRALPEIVAAGNRAGLDWSRVHVWFADERFVTADSPDRNVLVVAEAFREATGFSSEYLHAVPSSDLTGDAEGAASDYEAALTGTVPTNESGIPVLDLVLLGMGPDGHTASLFPQLLPDTDGIVAPVHDSPKPPSDRVTMTFTLLSASRHCWIYATGDNKRAALTRAFSDAATVADVPVSGVRASESVRCYLDAAAAPDSVR